MAKLQGVASTKWWLLSLTLLAAPVLLVLVAVNASPRETAFTIRAQSGLLMVEPDCNQSLTWDLPSGELRSLGAESPRDQQRKIGPVSIVIHAGAQAVLERREPDEWRVVVRPLISTKRCVDDPSGDATDGLRPTRLFPAASRIRALRQRYTDIDGKEVENELAAPSADGYAYRSVGNGVELAPLRLAGRVVIGKQVLEGGGWPGGSAGMLRGALVEGRTRQIVGDHLSVLVREEIDPGSIIDTHACLDPGLSDWQADACEAPGTAAAVGFAAASSNGGGNMIDVVVHRLTKRIGVLPYGGEQRTISVTWWTGFLHEPLAQQTAAAFAVLATVLGYCVNLRSVGDALLKTRRSTPMVDSSTDSSSRLSDPSSSKKASREGT